MDKLPRPEKPVQEYSRKVKQAFKKIQAREGFQGTIEDYLTDIEEREQMKVFRRLDIAADPYTAIQLHPLLKKAKQEKNAEATPLLLEAARSMVTSQLHNIEEVNFYKENESIPEFDLSTAELFEIFKQSALDLCGDYLAALEDNNLLNGHLISILKTKKITAATFDITDEEAITQPYLADSAPMYYNRRLMQTIWDLYFQHTPMLSSDHKLRSTVEWLCLHGHEYASLRRVNQRPNVVDLYHYMNNFSVRLDITPKEYIQKLQTCLKVWESIYTSAAANTTEMVYDLNTNSINIFHLELKYALRIYEIAAGMRRKES